MKFPPQSSNNQYEIYEGIQSVDFASLISDLYHQRENVDQAIVSLERSDLSSPVKGKVRGPRRPEIAQELRSLRDKIAQAILLLEPLAVAPHPQKFPVEMAAREPDFRSIATSFQAGIWGNSECSLNGGRRSITSTEIALPGAPRVCRTTRPVPQPKAMGSGAS